MKKTFKIFIVLFGFLFINSCASSSITITLYTPVDGEYVIYDTIQTQKDYSIDLPMVYTADDTVYVGWQDVNDEYETIYSGDVAFIEDISLMLVEEQAEDVFDLGAFADEPDLQSHVIYGYIGISQYVRIPQFIDGLEVVSIGPEAFKDSDLVEVYIPNSVRSVSHFAFQNSQNLENVEFYGDPIGTSQDVVTPEDFNDIMETYSDVCSIVSEEEGITTYSEDCPVVNSEESERIMINEVEYYSIMLEVKNNAFLENYNQVLHTGAFYDCVSLERIVMPIGGMTMFTDTFSNNPQLTDIIFREDHERYHVMDHIVYTYNDSQLFYYPGGLDSETYTIPETVTSIAQNAFYSNQYLKHIIIHDEVTEIRGSSFYNLPNLEAIDVLEGNETYSDIDGVLIYENEGLVKYPQNKSGSSYVIPDNILYIGDFAFAFNQNLEEINLGLNLTYIGHTAFMESEKITILDIPKTVESIGMNIIEGSHIEVVLLRRSMTEYDQVTILMNALCRDYNLVKVYVPDDSMEAYMLIRGWQYHANYWLEPLSTYEED